jgi:hypothetical protein
MARHDHAHEDELATPSRRPAPEVDEGPPELVQRALAAGRPDLLGHAGVRHLQRLAGNQGVSGIVDEAEAVMDAVGGGGSPLPADLRTDMESRLGADFGDVRIHTDSDAAASAEAVNAHAYTVGEDIVFQQGAFDPGSDAGKTTLAHELTHVVQQRSGPVDGTPTGGGIAVSDPGDRFEREAADTAARVMTEASPVQRAVEEEEEDLAP